MTARKTARGASWTLPGQHTLPEPPGQQQALKQTLRPQMLVQPGIQAGQDASRLSSSQPHQRTLSRRRQVTFLALTIFAASHAVLAVS